MTDNHNIPDDFDTQDVAGDYNQKTGPGANLAEAWRTKPLFKLLVLVIVVGAVVAVGSSLMSGGTHSGLPSNVVTPPDLKTPPGGVVSPYLQQQTQEANDKAAKEALESGKTNIPIPQGTVQGIEPKAADPLQEFKTTIENLQQKIVQVEQQQRQPTPQPQQPAPQVQAEPEKFDETLAVAMQHQMQQLNEGWKDHGIVTKQTVALTEVTANTSGVGATAYQSAMAGQYQTAVAQQQQLAAGSATTTSSAQPKTIVPAGTVSYGQLLTEANSDVPGPILVQIVSGPLAGARAVGQFTTVNDYLVLKFTLVHFKGKDYSIEAYALDPNTTLGGMATEVDHRYMVRVVLPAASAFLSGLGTALGQAPQTVVSTNNSTIVTEGKKGFKDGMYQGLGEAAKTAGQFFQNEANNTKALVRVASGTPMGVFFTTTVFDNAATTAYPYNVQNYPAGFNPAGGNQIGAAMGAMQGYGSAAGYNPYGAQAGYANPYAPAQSAPYNPAAYGASPSAPTNSVSVTPNSATGVFTGR